MDRRTRTVLVIDEDERERERCREVLEGEGFTVVPGRSKDDARAALEAQSVHAVVMDLFLSDGPTYELFEEQPTLADLPVVGLTNIFQGPTLRRLLRTRYPFAALLDKPLPGAKLVDLLRVHFGASYPAPPELSEVGTDSGEAFEAMHPVSGVPETELRPEDLLDEEEEARSGLPMPSLPVGLNWRKLPDQGDLSMVSFPALLTRLMRVQFTGALKLWRERVRKAVYFSNGVPCSVQSNLLYESLGQLLVRDGGIDARECEGAVARSKEQNKRLGAVLIEEGLLDEETLERLLHEQLRRRLLDIFGWGTARYQVVAQEKVPIAVTIDNDHATGLTIEGVLEHTRLERVIHDLVDQIHQQVRPLVSVAHLETLRVSEAQRPIIEAISRREHGTLLELIARFEESAQAYQTVYALAALGLIAFLPMNG